jgi:hypothetical protein
LEIVPENLDPQKGFFAGFFFFFFGDREWEDWLIYGDSFSFLFFFFFFWLVNDRLLCFASGECGKSSLFQ